MEDAVRALEGLVRYLARGLVERPEEVEVQAELRGTQLTLRLRVPEAEVGRILGRQGRTIQALRTLLRASVHSRNLRVYLDLEGR